MGVSRKLFGTGAFVTERAALRWIRRGDDRAPSLLETALDSAYEDCVIPLPLSRGHRPEPLMLFAIGFYTSPISGVYPYNHFEVQIIFSPPLCPLLGSALYSLSTVSCGRILTEWRRAIPPRALLPQGVTRTISSSLEL
ncbi:hypothetical protein F2P81_007825 [Scophthalmus maximus]|uniref:Uncharacterized protein n=1 Tax=Scophthalmus maximus TaxID=52904 RepID=A0A6A4T6I5_SCOMX|nr:hypothetical protein F2P81_007825 [Scophthalmus maximus]